MMDGDCFLRVYRFDNGYTVEIKDPAIVKYNAARDKKNSARKDGAPYLEYKDPWKSFVFDTAVKVQAFIGKNISKAIVAAKAEEADFGTAFDMAASTPEKE